MTHPLRLSGLLVLAPLAAAAQDGPRLAFTLGAGVSAVPSYFGSDEVEAGPDLAFSLDALDVGPLSFGGPRGEGLGFEGSFRYVPERDADELDGLAAGVDAAFELGGGLAYTASWYEAFAVARQGFGGHDGLVAEVGMNVIARPSERLTLSAGPFLLLGSDDYAATYFSTDTGFDAEGGLLSSGVEVGAAYRLSDAWAVEADLRLERLRGDAGRSPVSAEDDGVSAGLAVTRRFEFGF